TSGDVVFLPESSDEMFAAAHIGANEPFSICRRKTKQKGEFFEVHKLSDAQEPALDPRRYPDESGSFDSLPTAINSTPIERKLEASITQAQQRKANPSQVAPSAAMQSGAMTAPPRQSNSTAPGQTLASSMMASAMIAGFDACCLFEQYAKSKGIVSTFGPQDYRAVANTIYIQECETARQRSNAHVPDAGASAGASWRQ